MVICKDLFGLFISNRLELHLKEEDFSRMLKQLCNVKPCGLIWLMKWLLSFVAFVLRRCLLFPKKLIAIPFKISFGIHDCVSSFSSLLFESWMPGLSAARARKTTWSEKQSKIGRGAVGWPRIEFKSKLTFSFKGYSFVGVYIGTQKLV